jgi:hypothetical protein
MSNHFHLLVRVPHRPEGFDVPLEEEERALRTMAAYIDLNPALVERRALVFYRAIPGGQGAARKREDGTVVRRGLSEKVRERLSAPNERRLAAEALTRRVRHFTRGIIIGSRSFPDGWFEANRGLEKGQSRWASQPCGSFGISDALEAAANVGEGEKTRSIAGKNTRLRIAHGLSLCSNSSDPVPLRHLPPRPD